MSSLCSISRIVSPLAFSSRDQRLHLGGLGRVHAGGRLVEQQQPRPQRQRAGDLDPAAVGVGEAVGGLIEPRRQTVAEAREYLAAPRLRSAAYPRAHARAAATTRAQVPQSARSPASGGASRARRVCAPISTLSSTLRLANTRPCWKVRATPSAAIAPGEQPLDAGAVEHELRRVGAVEAADQVERAWSCRRRSGPMTLTSSPSRDFEVEARRRR